MFWDFPDIFFTFLLGHFEGRGAHYVGTLTLLTIQCGQFFLQIPVWHVLFFVHFFFTFLQHFEGRGAHYVRTLTLLTMQAVLSPDPSLTFLELFGTFEDIFAGTFFGHFEGQGTHYVKTLTLLPMRAVLSPDPSLTARLTALKLKLMIFTQLLS